MQGMKLYKATGDIIISYILILTTVSQPFVLLQLQPKLNVRAHSLHDRHLNNASIAEQPCWRPPVCFTLPSSTQWTLPVANACRCVKTTAGLRGYEQAQ